MRRGGVQARERVPVLEPRLEPRQQCRVGIQDHPVAPKWPRIGIARSEDEAGYG